MGKIDFKKEFKDLYGASAKRTDVVNVPAMRFLMIDGQGDPNTAQSFQEAVEALFSLSYAIKFLIKKGETAVDYGVLPLEGLWWSDDMADFRAGHKDLWKWTLMIMQPDLVTEAIVAEARQQVEKKKRPTALPLVRMDSFAEGNAAQILHLGPFIEEAATVEKLHAFIDGQGGELSGKHHEIYLSDTRRAAPEKWRTIIRQPFVSAGV